jgi:hypothetical protein
LFEGDQKNPFFGVADVWPQLDTILPLDVKDTKSGLIEIRIMTMKKGVWLNMGSIYSGKMRGLNPKMRGYKLYK